MYNFLSDKKSNTSRNFQVLEWQQRLEDLRLRDLRSRRNAEHWAKEVEHLRDLARSQALRVDQLEEETVRLENQMEQRQLDWETREVELETLEDEAARARLRGEAGGGGRGPKGDMDSGKLTMPGRMVLSVGWCFRTVHEKLHLLRG